MLGVPLPTIRGDESLAGQTEGPPDIQTEHAVGLFIHGTTKTQHNVLLFLFRFHVLLLLLLGTQPTAHPLL